MGLDFSNLEVRKRVIADIKSDYNKKRKATSLRQFRCYSNNLDQYVQERLLQSFSESTVKMMPVISSINLVSRIINQKSSVYTMPAKRSFTELDDSSLEAVEAVYADGAADNKMIRTNRFYNLQEQTHVYIKLVNGRIEFVPLLLHNIDAIPDDTDPEIAQAYVIANFDRKYLNAPPFSYKQVSNTGYRGTSDSGYISPSPSNMIIGDSEDYEATVERYTVWSDEFNFVMNGHGKVIVEEGEDEDMGNEIGIMPIIDVSQFKDFVYFAEKGSGLVEFCIDYNVALTDLMFISRLQGFAQGVASGDKEVLDKMTTIEMGPAHIIKLPNSPIDGAQTELKFINRGSDIKGSQDSIEMLLSNFLTAEGLDPKVVSGKGEALRYSSGTERLLAMVERFESSRAEYDLFKAVESGIYDVIKRYLNVYSSTEFLDEKYKTTVPEESEIEVSFKGPEMVQGESEKASSIILKLEAGLISRIEAIMEARSVSRETAEEILIQMKKDNGVVVNIIESNEE